MTGVSQKYWRKRLAKKYYSHPHHYLLELSRVIFAISTLIIFIIIVGDSLTDYLEKEDQKNIYSYTTTADGTIITDTAVRKDSGKLFVKHPSNTIYYGRVTTIQLLTGELSIMCIDSTADTLCGISSNAQLKAGHDYVYILPVSIRLSYGSSIYRSDYQPLSLAISKIEAEALVEKTDKFVLQEAL